MNDNLLQDFFQEEVSAFRKRQLLGVIREGKQQGSPVVREINFNRFFVVIDFEAQQVAVNDISHVSPSGKYKLGIDEFERLLLSIDPSR